MSKKLAAILTGIFISVFSLTTVSQAQTTNNQGLNAKQQGIVTIAAFTAKGDLERLKTALNEGLDAGLTVNECLTLIFIIQHVLYLVRTDLRASISMFQSMLLS